jgi:uncharacterized protein YuzE
MLRNIQYTKWTDIKTAYDKETKASYIYVDKQGYKKVHKTYSCDPTEVGGKISLDFDDDGKLLGIEILDADKKLPEAFSEEMFKPGV